MSHLGDSTIYVFVRGDLEEADQFIQSAHVVFKMTALLNPGFGDVKIVALDGGSSQKAFSKTLRKLKEAQVQHAEYSDSDRPEWGVTAIATAPLTKEQSLPLANYRLRRYSPPSDASSGVALDGQRGAKGCVSSEKEHSTFSREVAGSIPPHSSKFQKR